MTDRIGKTLWRWSPFCVLRYAFCPSRQAWDDLRRLARRRHGAELPEYPSTSGMTTYWEDNEGRLRVVVTLADWVDDDPVALVGILAHECYHVVCRISEAMADKKPSEEFVAYALSEVTSQMFADYSVVRSPLARAQRAEAGANGS